MTISNVQPLPKVRIATPLDIDDLLRLGDELHAENAIMPKDDTVIRQCVVDAILGRASVIAVIGEIGEIQGAIHLAFNRFWYTSDVHLAELWAFVRPQYRKSRNAVALIEFAKSMAVEFKTPLFIGVVSNTDTEKKIRMYRRRLGEPAGAYFLYNGRTGD
jgi:hypothetical protein